jgi:LysM repeat protein
MDTTFNKKQRLEFKQQIQQPMKLIITLILAIASVQSAPSKSQKHSRKKEHFEECPSKEEGYTIYATTAKETTLWELAVDQITTVADIIKRNTGLPDNADKDTVLKRGSKLCLITILKCHGFYNRYTVQLGDTLGNIALAHLTQNSDWPTQVVPAMDQILLLNPTVENSDVILEGWEMCLPNTKYRYFDTCDHQVYKIQLGDWMSKIIEAQVLNGR